MKIILTPAKKMKKEVEFFEAKSVPVMLLETKQILARLQMLSIKDLQKVLKCSQRLAKETYENYQTMDLCQNTVPALFAYQGIQFDHLGAELFSDDEYDYIEKNLVILSGFYGLLRPFDGVVSYRLELNNSLSVDQYKNLYQFWNRKIYDQLILDDHCLLDLGAKQYSMMIQKYLSDDIRYVKCYFKEEIADELKEIGVYVKIARGEMIRYLIQKKAASFEDVKAFDMLGYRYREELSDACHYVFVRKKQPFMK